MTITVYDFESGTNGANVTVAGDVLAVSASPPTYATAAAFTSSTLGQSSTAQQWAEYDIPGTSDNSGSVYIKVTTNPGTSSCRVVSFRTAAAAFAGGIRFHSAGTIGIVNTANSLVGASSAVTWLTTDTFRLDWQADDTGTDVLLTVRIFKNSNIGGTTPDDTIARTIPTTDFERIRIGSIDTGAWTVQLDNFQLSTVLEWIGPYSPALVPLPTPVVTVTNENNPSTPGGTDGEIIVTWPAVVGAVDHYAAAIADGHDVTSGFTIVDSSATSPHTFTGLDAGNYTVAIRAVP